MKRRIIFALLALLLPLFALAQKGLHANAAFTGQIVPQDQTVEVKVRGRALSAYRLTFYHSVRFKANAQQKSTMDNLVEKDKAQHRPLARNCDAKVIPRRSSSACHHKGGPTAICATLPTAVKAIGPSLSCIWKAR